MFVGRHVTDVCPCRFTPGGEQKAATAEHAPPPSGPSAAEVAKIRVRQHYNVNLALCILGWVGSNSSCQVTGRGAATGGNVESRATPTADWNAVCLPCTEWRRTIG